MKYVNETDQVLELEWEREPPKGIKLLNRERYGGPTVTLTPGMWFEPFGAWDGTHIVIRLAKP